MITKISRTVRLVAPDPGQIEEDIYRLSRDEHNNCIYKCAGKQNVNEYVNSFKNSCSLQAILNRIQFMPVNEKIQYLNQTDPGAGADLSIFPSDPNELYLLMKKYEKVLPAISSELNAGKSLDSIIKSIFTKKEVSDNGSTESSDAGSAQV